MSSSANPPKPTNVKMNPRFSFGAGSFKAGFNRRGSNCTAVTEQSPATTSDENEGSEESFQSCESSSYDDESSSDYDDSMESSEEESGSEYSDLMDQLPFQKNARSNAPSPHSSADGRFSPMQVSMHGVVEESEGDLSPYEGHDTPKEGLLEGNGSDSGYGELVSLITTARQGPIKPTTSSVSPAVIPAYAEEFMFRDASVQGGSFGNSSEEESGESSMEDSDDSEKDSSEMGSSEACDSSSDYGDMMHELPVAMGRKGPMVGIPPVQAPIAERVAQAIPPARFSQMPFSPEEIMKMHQARQGDEQYEDSSGDYSSDESGESESESSGSDTTGDKEYSSSGYGSLMNNLPITLASSSKDVRQQIRHRDIQERFSSSTREGHDMDDNHSDGGFSVEDESGDESSSYDSDDSGSDFSTDDDMDSSGSEDSSDWSSSDGSSYGDLMKEMTHGRQPVPVAKSSTPAVAAPMVPVCPVPSADIPCEDPPAPMEGLAMLQNIKAELQKVGQMIVKNKDGEKFLRRAQILASINYLASNVPRCVLEDLGQEIREQLKKQEEEKTRRERPKTTMAGLLKIELDDASVASDISHLDDHHTFGGDKSFADSLETDSDEDEEDDFFPSDVRTPETARRKSVMENFVPLKNAKSIRESRLSLSTHSSGHMFAPKLRQETCPERRGASRTYSFASVASMSLSSASTESDISVSDTLPILTYFECALLFVDISGFTKLSTLLDPENLSKVINTYFEVRFRLVFVCASQEVHMLTVLFWIQLLVSHVSDFNGDIQKFAGDALFAEFRATPKCPLSKCCELAAACAASLVRNCSDFPVSTICGLMDTEADGIPASLNVHCGLGIGEMAGLHIGDNENRREYLYLGNPIKQTAHACDFAQLGEAAASREFCQQLNALGVFEADLTTDQDAYVIAERANSFLHVNEAELLAAQRINARSRGITEHVEGLEPESLKEYRRLMSLYVHPVAVSNDVAAENDFTPSSRAKDKNNSRDRQLEEAELRSCYTMFVNPKVSVEITGDATKDTASVEIVHEIMKIANRELRRYNGHMRQFVMDDKGMVFIATFGLRGSTFPNMVGERALPATIAIHNALQLELGIEAKIGATFGDAYCGAVGGEKRHEYAVMGPSVNLAAR